MRTGICICRPLGPDKYGFEGLIALNLDEARMLRKRLDAVLSEFDS